MSPTAIDKRADISAACRDPVRLRARYDSENALAPSRSILMQAYETGSVPNERGEQVEIFPGAISLQEGRLLYWLVREIQPAITLETGFGFGMSACFILSALANNGAGRHFSVDPSFRHWTGGVGLHTIRRLGFETKFKILEAPSWLALPDLFHREQSRNLLRSQLTFAFIDGCHHFDVALLDFFYLDLLMPPGGLIVFDDVEMPALETLIDFIRANRAYDVHIPISGIALCWKLEHDTRNWDHFRPFAVAQRKDGHRADD